jgi:acetyltransferase
VDAGRVVERTPLLALLGDRCGSEVLSPDPLVDLLVRVGDLAATVDAVAELSLNPILSPRTAR